MSRTTITRHATGTVLKYLAVALTKFVAWRDGDVPGSRPEYIQEGPP